MLPIVIQQQQSKLIPCGNVFVHKCTSHISTSTVTRFVLAPGSAAIDLI